MFCKCCRPRFLCRHPGLLFMCVFRLPSGGAFVLVIEPSRTPMQFVPAPRQGRFLLLSQCSLGWHSPVQHPGSLGNLILQGENIKRGDTSSTKLEQDQRWVKIASYWGCQFQAKLHLSMDNGLGFSVCHIRSEKCSLCIVDNPHTPL